MYNKQPEQMCSFSLLMHFVVFHCSGTKCLDYSGVPECIAAFFSLLFLTYLCLWPWSLSGSPPEAMDESLQRRLEDLDRSFVFPRSALGVQLSTARAGLSYCPEARAFLQAEQPIRGGQNGLSRDTKYQVFRDLRGRGFYLTSAGKFGGDFLVYPGERVVTGPSLHPYWSVSIQKNTLPLSLSPSGDPLRFHAHFIAVCLAADEAVGLLDVLAVARLGSNVKKTVLLCSPAEDGAVTYTSLQWSGMA